MILYSTNDTYYLVWFGIYNTAWFETYLLPAIYGPQRPYATTGSLGYLFSTNTGLCSHHDTHTNQITIASAIG